MVLLDDKWWEWIDIHSMDDVTRLWLSCGNNESMQEATLQVECRQKATKKLPNTLLCRRFMFPSTLSAEQCTSDELARIHAKFVPSGSKVLDMTCGLGIDTFHIAQQAQAVVSCEINSDAAFCAKHNCDALGIDNVTIINTDSCDYIHTLPHDSFDCIFIDPARRGANGQRLFALSECAPDVTKILSQLLDIAPLLVIKASPMLDVQHTISELNAVQTCVSQVLAIGTPRECKELVVICQRSFKSNPILGCITTPDKYLTYSIEDEQRSTIAYDTPNVGDILYEPFPSTMKIAPLKLLTQQYGLVKLAPSTHIYFSPNIISECHCRAHKIIRIDTFDKRGIKSLTANCTDFDITTRNFPLSTVDLAKKLRVKNSSSKHRLFAVTNSKNKKLLILTEPV